MRSCVTIGEPMRRLVAFPALVTLAVLSSPAWAQSDEAAPLTHDPKEPPPEPPPAPAPEPPPAPAPAPSGPKVTPLGYVEAHYAFNFNRPANGITNYRGFDNRHSSVTLNNAVLGATWEAGPVGGRLLLQIGSQPASYYSGEPALAGSGAANASGPELWKYIQEAFVTYRAPVGSGIVFQLGLCASPIGFESLPIKDNWNWSRSNLFFGLPYYHTGLRATYAWTDAISTTFAVWNGWNSVVDNNEEKSVEARVNYKTDSLELQALYFGGIERPKGSPEGPYWRHHFDATAQLHATSYLSFAGQTDYGFEPNRFGLARWYTGALYARVKPVERVFVAVRGDRFHEDLAYGSVGTSSPIFFGGAQWVSSGTLTLDVRPHDNLSVRLELRHDRAEAPLYFSRSSPGDGSAQNPYVATATRQNTILLGATAWF